MILKSLLECSSLPRARMPIQYEETFLGVQVFIAHPGNSNYFNRSARVSRGQVNGLKVDAPHSDLLGIW
jgi:hypothetical protein